MISILRVEFFRLVKSKLFWIMLGVCFGLPLLYSLFMLGVTGILESVSTELPEFADLDYLLRSMGITSAALSELPSIAGNVGLLSLITSSVILSKEFTDGTVRNAILANKNRKQLYFGYLIVALFIGIAYMFAYFIATLIFVAPIFGFNDLSAGEIATGSLCSLALGIFAVIFVQTCVTMFLFATRRQWATILFPILICRLLPSIFNIVVSIITVGEAFQGGVISNEVYGWIPFANASLFNASAVDGALMGKIIMYYVVCSAVFIVSGYFPFKKADLK